MNVAWNASTELPTAKRENGPHGNTRYQYRSRSALADTAVRLAAALGTSKRFWRGLQTDYDLQATRHALGMALTPTKPITADCCLKPAAVCGDDQRPFT
ncbi:MAG: hypothetical protein Q8J93_07970 [Xanthomonadales bacterium]|nr:hypothetical protein [Xanthomonadales bacterium]MDZ4115172.1 hypothetical protein [Xanthomonadaceae bacterium]MDZ4377853.1 hypothetical protein [Xanthomonadaceae bacterium]